ncbi:methyltransferase, FxLD system [Nocardiopsis rhodophaea]|uniref:methyltransferase, FxLD system n=1 Tax=Nocardiopsis rhodophaea TaxID=280238 RepID=UPI0031DD6B74
MHEENAELRQRMVDTLAETGAIVSAKVKAAMRTVPRHLFAPEAPPEDAYAPDAPVAIKHDPQGRRTSSLSSAHTQATMLEQADITPGMRVLEVGSGGYNAALIAELVGDDGEVTSIDIDPDITDRARRYLDAAGYHRVRVICADAEYGLDEHAPYDRILVTAGAWDIPPAWVDQLAPQGRMVVPLRMRGLTRTIAFDHTGGHLTSRPDHHLTQFVSMTGAGAHPERGIAVQGDDIQLFAAETEVDVPALREALHAPRLETWPGVEFSYPDRLHLWVVGHADNYALLYARPDVLEPGPNGPLAPAPIPVLLGEQGSLALRTKRRMGEGRFEVGVFAYGPHGEKLADQYVEILRAWEGRSGAMARIEAWPAGTPDAELPQDRAMVLDKRHTRIVLAWP